MSFSFMTDSGYEGYAYDFGDHDNLKGVKCQLHEHFGGNPIFAAAVSFKVDGTGYAALTEFIRTVYGHAESVVLDLIPDEDSKDMFKKGAKNILPVFKRLDDAIAKQLLPAMKDGGLGIVLDAKWKSKQWVRELPAMPKEMPMVELGLLLGISDAKRFETGMKEIRLALNELYAKVRETSNDNIPEFKIPAPETEKAKNGSLIYWPLPEDLGLDKQFHPMIGVGKSVSLIALSKSHTERLLSPTPLTMKGAPLARKGDLVGACVLDWNALVDAAAPWIEFGITTGMAGDKAPKGAPKVEDVLKQVKVVLTVLKCYKGMSNATYVEDGKLVSHTQIVVKDLASAPAKD